MSDIIVKNISPKTYEQLKYSAIRHRRSLEHEIIVRLERTLSPPKKDKATIIAEARALREKTKGFVVSEEELFHAKSEGRL